MPVNKPFEISFKNVFLVSLQFSRARISPSLKISLFPIHWLGEIKNSYQRPAGRNFIKVKDTR